MNTKQIQKKASRDEVTEKLRALGCDTIEILAHFAMSEELDVKDRIKAAIELNCIQYPRLKAIEKKPDYETEEKLNELDDLKKMMEDLVKKNKKEF